MSKNLKFLFIYLKSIIKVFFSEGEKKTKENNVYDLNKL